MARGSPTKSQPPLVSAFAPSNAPSSSPKKSSTWACPNGDEDGPLAPTAAGRAIASAAENASARYANLAISARALAQWSLGGGGILEVSSESSEASSSTSSRNSSPVHPGDSSFSFSGSNSVVASTSIAVGFETNSSVSVSSPSSAETVASLWLPSSEVSICVWAPTRSTPVAAADDPASSCRFN